MENIKIQKRLILVFVISFSLFLIGCDSINKDFKTEEESSLIKLSPDGKLDPANISPNIGISIERAFNATINAGFLDSISKTGNKIDKMELQLFPDYTFKTTDIRINRSSEYEEFVSGGGLNDKHFMSLVKSESGLSGVIKTDGWVYRLIPSDKKNITILKIDVTKFPPGDEPKIWSKDTTRKISQRHLVVDTSLSHIHDLLIVYTDDVADKKPDFSARIVSAITQANIAYQNSNIRIKLNLVGMQEVKYNESKDTGTDLDRLTKTNDGYLDEVHRLRDRYGADLVLLLVLDAGLGKCGRANLQISSSDSDDDRAFAMADIDCLDNQALTHELGHIAGAHHNTGHDPFPVPSYAHGWVRPDQFSPNKGWRSIMAYNTGDCGDRPRGCEQDPAVFSNPNIKVGGKPAGNKTANNARRLNETAQALAGFRIQGARISLYEGNQSTQDHVCSIPIDQNRTINFSSNPNERGCDNDEARSATLFDVKAGKVLRLFDHPDGDRQDDWTEIIIKSDISQLDIPSFERSFENSDVQVIYHRNNGLDGKVSRLEIDSRSTGSVIDLFEGNNTTQNLVCSVPIGQQRTYRFPDHAACDNDEARSASLHNIQTGQVIRIFDSPDGSRQDDWTEIIVKRNINKADIPSFERSFENSDVRVIYHRKNGLDGKVSRLEVDSTPTGAIMDLFEGNNTTQNLVCSVPIGQQRTYRFPDHSACDNDEARSATLFNARAGQVLRVFDSPDGSRQDDWTEIIVKRNISNADIPSFERSFENSNIRVTYYRKNGLDGKVSRLEVSSTPIGSIIDLFEGNNATQNLVCSVPIGQQRTYRFPDHSACNNDEARSATLFNARAGQVLRIFDSPDGSRQDDWTEIIVKRNLSNTAIPSFERSFENSDVRVIYHRNNGLDGKVSRLEVGTTPSGAMVDLFEGTNATQNLVCSLPVGQPQTYRFSGASACTNDEARSAILYNIPAGTVLLFYDNPNGNLDDDWLAIRVKRNISSLQINTFERSFSNSQVDVVYSRNNGLNGKVSRLVVTNGNRMEGVASFFEGNNGTQNKVCDLQIYDREVRFRGHGRCDNDEARSVILSLVPAGTQIRIYDNPDCQASDDFTVIHVKQDIFRLIINSFERPFENNQVKVTFNRRNGLDGKVSCVWINKP